MENETKIQDEQLIQTDLKLRLKRGGNRRINQAVKGPPYVTEEGLVLVDRRSNVDRRGNPQGGEGRR